MKLLSIYAVLGTIQVIFLTFKLLGILNWAWLWVLAPTWIPIACVMIFAIIFTIVMSQD